jgi:hypothetical protein
MTYKFLVLPDRIELSTSPFRQQQRKRHGQTALMIS